MPRVRRNISAFSLSFLDVMSCGFGAVVLLFLILKHNIDIKETRPTIKPVRPSEVSLLQEEIDDGRKNLAKIRNTISEIDEALAEAKGLASRILEEKKDTAALTERILASANSLDLESIKARLKSAQIQNQEVRKQITKTGEDARRMEGEGKRQYLTGLRVKGNHILILLDSSASMLDDTIVNIIRFRNMRDELKRNAPKWRRAIRIVQWLTARMPVNSQYQVYTFNMTATSVLPDTTGKWMNVHDSIVLTKAVDGLDTVVPQNGTDLENAFASASRLSPHPDSIYVITDGLPTQGSGAPSTGKISSRQRLKLFGSAIKKLPSHVPVNIVLVPLEGDPDAAPAFWGLARATDGSFMTPSKDWP